MADQIIYYQTKLPSDIAQLISNHCSTYDHKLEISSVLQNNTGLTRNSLHAWVPTSDWIASFIWYYINNVNRVNFKYDLTCIDANMLQYTVYNEGQYYKWHIDAGLRTLYQDKKTITFTQQYATDVMMAQADHTRKLSFSLQLSSSDDYTGGELQFIDEDDQLHKDVPKDLGTLVIFDSRTKHRVTKVRSGQRRSLVGWVMGPRWK